MKTYTELLSFSTFEERFNYLCLNGKVAEETFGFDRWINQQFYKSQEWRRIRRDIILRDEGCDLGILDRPIGGVLLVHHMNPLSLSDFKNSTEFLLNPEYLITTKKLTHDAIHYGDASLLMASEPVIRKPNDTIPWR